jgi:hypothetical protein
MVTAPLMDKHRAVHFLRPLSRKAEPPLGFEKMFEERQGVDAETNRALMKAHHMEVVGPPLK